MHIYSIFQLVSKKTITYPQTLLRKTKKKIQLSAILTYIFERQVINLYTNFYNNIYINQN